jgi:hypothetical protein
VVSVASGTFTDVAANANADGLDANNSVTLTVDTALPTVAITPDTASIKAGETATLTFTFSEDVGVSFTAGDISVSGGTLGALTRVDATHYTAVFTPTPGSTANGVVSVASGKFSDVAGNANADGLDVDNSVTLTVDTALPTVAITPTQPASRPARPPRSLSPSAKTSAPASPPATSASAAARWGP